MSTYHCFRTSHRRPLGDSLIDGSATYQGSRLLLRAWNSEEAFVSSYRLDFEPQIPAQCDNCAMLEYTLAGDSIFGNGFEPS